MNHFKETKTLLDQSNFYYMVAIDMEGKYTYVNTHYANAFIGGNGDFAGKSYDMTVHPDDVAICREVVKKCFKHPGKLFPATIRKHDIKGDYIFTQWEYKAMFDQNNKPAGVFCLGYDITKFVAEKRQLQLAEEEIEKKALILKEIAFQQSHLIRGPLSNILGLAKLLEKTGADAETIGLCKMILESSKQLDNVVRSIVGNCYTVADPDVE